MREREEYGELFESTQLGVPEMWSGSSTSEELTRLKGANIHCEVLLETMSARSLA